MRKLLVAAFLMLSVVGAQAVQLPTEFLGTWDNGTLQVRPDGYDGQEEGCRFDRITKLNEGYRIQMTCSAERRNNIKDIEVWSVQHEPTTGKECLIRGKSSCYYRN